METNALLGQNFCTIKAGAAVTSGSANTYVIGTTFYAAVGGKACSGTANTGLTTPTTDAVSGAAITLAASQARAIVWCVNVSGTVKVVAGPVTSWDGTVFGGNTGASAPLFPDIPDSLTPYAYQILKASSTASAFTFGTSNWNATGITSTVVDVLVLPSRPQTS